MITITSAEVKLIALGTRIEINTCKFLLDLNQQFPSEIEVDGFKAQSQAGLCLRS